MTDEATTRHTDDAIVAPLWEIGPLICPSQTCSRSTAELIAVLSPRGFGPCACRHA